VNTEVGAGFKFESCAWFSTYRIHHRSASRFRAGRCFVLGDAAHIHSPMGAQGMNTGMQDAYNLAWKLGLVVKGIAGEALLDSYESERVPVARRLLNTTDRAFRLVVSDSWFAGLLRTQVLARVATFAMSRKRVQRTAFRTVSQIGIRYRKSGLSQSLSAMPEGAPQAGDRFPWLKLRLKADGQIEDLFHARDDTKFSLMVFGQEWSERAVPDLGGLLHTDVVPAGDLHNAAELSRAAIPGVSFYLVRPDGYIGLCGEKVDVAAVMHYLQSRIGIVQAPMATPAPASPGSQIFT
jgi:hypothetical protein